MTRVLGVDPGSRATGYGIIDTAKYRLTPVAYGVIRLPAVIGFPERLKIIFDDLTSIIQTYQPDLMVIEVVFVKQNVNTALKLGQARGAAIVAGVTRGLPIAEITPAQVKQSIVGKGNAEKSQVQYMVKLLLSLREIPPPDAADALAVAIAHVHIEQSLRRLTPLTANLVRN